MAKLYLNIIFSVICLLIGINSFLAIFVYETTAWALISTILSSVTLIVLIDTFFAILIGILPKKWFSMKNKCFNVSKKEQMFYEQLSIRKWKDQILELGWLGGFSKRKIKDPKNPKYYERFIVESNRGIVEHLLGTIFGFSIMFIYPNYMWTVGLPISVVNLILNILPTMILRYNIPKLKAVHTGLIKRQQNTNTENQLSAFNK